MICPVGSSLWQGECIELSVCFGVICDSLGPDLKILVCPSGIPKFANV